MFVVANSPSCNSVRRKDDVDRIARLDFHLAAGILDHMLNDRSLKDLIRADPNICAFTDLNRRKDLSEDHLAIDGIFIDIDRHFCHFLSHFLAYSATASAMEQRTSCWQVFSIVASTMDLSVSVGA